MATERALPISKPVEEFAPERNKMKRTEMAVELREPNAGLQCPSCRVSLVMTERQNIEIDYCPQCRGVWLDRGELDKIIERSLPEQQVAPQRDTRDPRDDRNRDSYRDHDHDRYRSDKHGRKKHGYRRKSWLEELFD